MRTPQTTHAPAGSATAMETSFRPCACWRYLSCKEWISVLNGSSAVSGSVPFCLDRNGYIPLPPARLSPSDLKPALFCIRLGRDGQGCLLVRPDKLVLDTAPAAR